MHKVKRRRIFFLGELPPRTIHGASVSNLINVNILKKRFQVDCLEEFSDLRYHSSFSNSKMLSFLSVMFAGWVCALRFNYDYYYGVIYLSRLGIIKNILSVFIFKLFNPYSKVILHFHRSDFEKFVHNKFNRLLFNFLDIAITKYIVLSKQQIVEVRNYTSKEICLLYNTIEELDAQKIDTLYDPNSISLLFLSNYIKEKGLSELIEAVRELNKIFPGVFKLNCFGGFSNDSYKMKILKCVECDENIFINGPVYGKDKIRALENSDLVMLPSYNEGLPLIVLEAISIGKPIVVSNVGYIHEVLGTEYEFYCEPRSVASIVETVIKFKAVINKEKLQEMLKLTYSKFSHRKHVHYLNLIFN